MARERPWMLALAAPERLQALEELCKEAGLGFSGASATAEAASIAASSEEGGPACVVCALGRDKQDSCWPLLRQLRGGGDRQVFIIVLSVTAARSVRTRLECFAAGANMVTESLPAVRQALQLLLEGLASGGDYACPTCGLAGLSEDALHTHGPLYHAAEPNCGVAACCICGEACGPRSPFEVHLNNCHGPPDRREPEFPSFAAFSWGVCRRRTDGKFLLVNEPAAISRGVPGYWLPAGRVDEGETLAEAACRECLEEAGVRVRAVGVLRFMLQSGTPRVVFLTEPEDEDAEPKSVPDWESVGALWVDAADLEELNEEDYRAPDPARFYPKVASGELVAHPLDTPAFGELESMIQRLTSGERISRSEQMQVWERVRKAYPASAFRISG